MKKIEIDAKLVTGVLAVAVTVDFRLSDNPFLSFIKADSALETLHALEIISDEELEQFQKMLDVNYSCFTEIEKGESNKKEGDINWNYPTRHLMKKWKIFLSNSSYW